MSSSNARQPLTQKEVIKQEYEKEIFSEKSLQMKQHLVFDSSLDPPAMFSQYFGIIKPQGVRYWKDFFNEKLPEKPRFYMDSNDRACLLVSFEHDRVTDVIDFMLSIINNGSNHNYKFEKFITQGNAANDFPKEMSQHDKESPLKSLEEYKQEFGQDYAVVSPGTDAFFARSFEEDCFLVPNRHKFGTNIERYEWKLHNSKFAVVYYSKTAQKVLFLFRK
ncbi:hypothetical protein C9374_014617 [Naegleria lovaniensis]|uniref:Uncharacterized protein n=1 Tax=Naegleria lovaniensis TaxID=51637 RepID=A0AA88KUI7_NAELO|nr:uncharacterized protein C9374_014617 [Naegleria lovaniensis]KAG2389217.1 hypothetical protein C9374_014617 [Naegleria lovaniensis]